MNEQRLLTFHAQRLTNKTQRKHDTDQHLIYETSVACFERTLTQVWAIGIVSV